MTRNAEMVEMRRRGLTLQQIGEHYGVSRQRVKQILADEPVPLKAGHYRNFFYAVGVAARLQFRADNGGTVSEHGTRGRYQWGCKCAACRGANRDHTAALRNRDRGVEVHNASGYRNYGCRCPICTEAHTTMQREYRQRRRAAA